ncbi:MAG: class I SAM-dependent methyltransferase [Actinomycetia bacterium]|nr:class I SAM-dependent methyltransferase [Actinomycetes bacterium]
MSFDDVWLKVAEIPGWLTQGQARVLAAAAARAAAGDTIVEIGSFRGRSTVVLATAAAIGAQVVAIEPHAGNDRGPGEIHGYADAAATDHDAFLANLSAAGVADRVRHVRAYSDRAHGDVVGEIAVLYIDGAHRYGPARADIRDWGKRVSPNGTLLIHDSFSSVGVTLAIMRELAFGCRFRYVGRSRSLAEYRADLDGSPTRRLRNGGRQLLQLPWFIKNLLVKVLLTLKVDTLVRKVTGREPEWPY